MSSPEGIILEQLNDELKERGIKVGNKVKLRNGDIDTIKNIIYRPYGNCYPIVLGCGTSYSLDGSLIVRHLSQYDIVDWDYKEPIEDNLTSNHRELSYWNFPEVSPPDIFIKHDVGKPMVSLINPKFIEGLAEVMTQGANKYGRDNWQECKEPHRYLDALLRHTLKYWDGEKLDTESGKSHLYHIAFNAMALDYLDNKLKD